MEYVSYVLSNNRLDRRKLLAFVSLITSATLTLYNTALPLLLTTNFQLSHFMLHYNEKSES